MTSISVRIASGQWMTVAGVHLDRATLACKYNKTIKRATFAAAKPKGRLTNVASMSSQSNKYSNQVHHRFLPAKTECDITSIVQELESDMEEGTEKEVWFHSATHTMYRCPRLP